MEWFISNSFHQLSPFKLLHWNSLFSSSNVLVKQNKMHNALHSFWLLIQQSQLQYDLDTDSIKIGIDVFFITMSSKKEKFEIIETSWGLQSRKPMPRWINFAEFSEETT